MTVLLLTNIPSEALIFLIIQTHFNLLRSFFPFFVALKDKYFYLSVYLSARMQRGLLMLWALLPHPSSVTFWGVTQHNANNLWHVWLLINRALIVQHSARGVRRGPASYPKSPDCVRYRCSIPA